MPRLIAEGVTQRKQAVVAILVGCALTSNAPVRLLQKVPTYV
jgi:hypothetical protein